MTTRDTAFAPGTPCWVDLYTSDPDAAVRFYGGVLGWTASEPAVELGGYVNFSSDGHLVAGMMRNDGSAGTPDVWSTYLSTDDIEASVAAATGAGAHVVVAATDVADLGRMAVLVDAGDAAVGLWQPGRHTGFGKYNEPGAVTWDELHARAFQPTLDFYAAVFGWTYDVAGDSDDFRYRMAKVGGDSGDVVAGVMDSARMLPEGVPAHWTQYFSVPDVDQAAAVVEELGGRVLQPASDTPYGRVAQASDTTGAAFMLHQVSPG